MDEERRNDAPSKFRLGRRTLVAGGVASVLGLSMAPFSVLHAAAADPEGFMRLSRLLIPHVLNDTVGRRIASAMSARNSDMQAQVSKLLATADKKRATVVEDFFADVPEGPLKVTAL